MAELPEHPTHLEAETHFRGLLEEEGMSLPDEVRHEVDPDEVLFIWHEPKVAIVIELGPEGVEVKPGGTCVEPPV